MFFISLFARALGLASALCLLSVAQEPVAVGKGSYAAFPPPGSAFDKQKNIDRVAEVEQRQLYLLTDDGGPVPSNKWYQNLIFQQYGTGLWSYPHKVDATNEGIEIFYPTKPAGDGSRMVTDFPLVLAGKAAQLPVTGDTLGITYEGRSYGVFAPDGTKFEQGADGIGVAFSGKSSYLIVCPLPAARDLPIFHKHAFAIPRYTNEAKKTRTFIAWNPTAKPQTVTFYQGANPLVKLEVLPHSIASKLY